MTMDDEQDLAAQVADADERARAGRIARLAVLQRTCKHDNYPQPALAHHYPRWPPKTGHVGTLQNRPYRKPTQDIDSGEKLCSSRQHGQCFERG